MEDKPQKSLLGLSRNELAKLSEGQNNCCAICKKPCQSQKRLAIDHNHKTGVVRGLLCMSCNTKLGWYEKYSDEIERHLARDVRQALD